MKKLFGLALITCICWACEEENLPLPSPSELRYTHEIMDCAFGGPEVNCTEYVELRSNGQADYLFGGGDIVQSGTYEQSSALITLHTGTATWGSMEFEIVDDSTLYRNSDQTIWSLDRN